MVQTSLTLTPGLGQNTLLLPILDDTIPGIIVQQNWVLIMRPLIVHLNQCFCAGLNMVYIDMDFYTLPININLNQNYSAK
jgi:hypothetical protein